MDVGVEKKMVSNGRVPVLITCDVDPTPEVALKDKQEALDQTSVLLDDHGVKATFFVVAGLAKEYDGQIKALAQRGHEIGCHGLTHDETEEYHTLPAGVQRDTLSRATEMLGAATGTPVRSFRGPRVKTSHVTQQILEGLGYWADSSVCSQRMDFISSNLINPGWVFAPRLPYHPRSDSAFRRGRRKIVVVPVSALGLPFLSGVLYFLGLRFMERFFDILYFESKKTGKPIVYLMHPAEFAKPTQRVSYRSSLDSIRARGFYFRRRMKLCRGERERLGATQSLLAYMGRFPDVTFMTVREYVAAMVHTDRMADVSGPSK